MPLVVGKPTNRIILGLMTFGESAADGGRITDLATFNKALDVFQSRGYNEVDTARVYVGEQQEAFTAKAGWKERGLTLATKVRYPKDPGDNAGDKVIQSVEESLKALGTDRVDLLYLHRADRGVPFAETLAAVDKLHKQGKFIRLGLSNFTAFELAEVVLTCQHNGWIRPTVYQGMYNAITRNIESELFVACRRYGLDIVVYNPLAGGLFSGKIKSQDILPESGRFSHSNGSQGQNYRERYFKDSAFEALKLMEEVADKHKLSMIEMALRWVVHHSQLKVTNGNDGILIGVSSVEQLEQNLDNLEKGPLPEGVVQALDQAWKISKPDSTVYWHGDLEYTYDTKKALFGEHL